MHKQEGKKNDCLCLRFSVRTVVTLYNSCLHTDPLDKSFDVFLSLLPLIKIDDEIYLLAIPVLFSLKALHIDCRQQSM